MHFEFTLFWLILICLSTSFGCGAGEAVEPTVKNESTQVYHAGQICDMAAPHCPYCSFYPGLEAYIENKGLDDVPETPGLCLAPPQTPCTVDSELDQCLMGSCNYVANEVGQIVALCTTIGFECFDDEDCNLLSSYSDEYASHQIHCINHVCTQMEQCKPCDCQDSYSADANIND